MSAEPDRAGSPHNRSVPADVILPHLIYEDVDAALAWLSAAFGFTERYRYGPPDGPAQGAQTQLGAACVMLGSARPGRASPRRLGAETGSLTVFVPDVDAHCARARAAGAAIFEEINETAYGERQYGAADPEGRRWIFSQHARDVAPEEWGARVPPR
jgi:uncharacterized glyoxalase superfamily protein PhnB